MALVVSIGSLVRIAMNDAPNNPAQPGLKAGPEETPRRLTDADIRAMLDEAGIDVEAVIRQAKQDRVLPVAAALEDAGTRTVFRQVEGTRMAIPPMPAGERPRFDVYLEVHPDGKVTYDVVFDGTWMAAGKQHGTHVRCRAGDKPTFDRSTEAGNEKGVPMTPEEEQAVVRAVRIAARDARP